MNKCDIPNTVSIYRVTLAPYNLQVSYRTEPYSDEQNESDVRNEYEESKNNTHIRKEFPVRHIGKHVRPDIKMKYIVQRHGSGDQRQVL